MCRKVPAISIPNADDQSALSSFPAPEGDDFEEPTHWDNLKKTLSEVEWKKHSKTVALKTGKVLGHGAAILGSSAFNLVWRTLCMGGRFVKDTHNLFVNRKINPPQFLDGRWRLLGQHKPLPWSPQKMPDGVEFYDEALNALKVGTVSLAPLACLVLNVINTIGETAWDLGADIVSAVKDGKVARPAFLKTEI